MGIGLFTWDFITVKAGSKLSEIKSKDDIISWDNYCWVFFCFTFCLILKLLLLALLSLLPLIYKLVKKKCFK